MDADWESLFWFIFERSSTPVMLFDTGRRVIAVNHPATDLLGRSRRELESSSILNSVVPGERAESAEQWRGFLRTGEYSGSRDLLRPDGDVVNVRFAARLADVGGRRIAVYVFMVASDEHDRPMTPAAESCLLTNREREVVSLIALGLDTNAIAQRLVISPETVRTHVRNAMGKLGAHTRAQLVASVLSSEQSLHPGVVSASAGPARRPRD